jgi:hypothetical protein
MKTRAPRLLAARVAMGFAVAVACGACASPTSPIARPADVSPAPLGPQWPPPVQSAAGCDLYLQGIVVDGRTGNALSEATVNWRYFDSGSFDSTNEFRADVNGSYNVCVPLPAPLSIDCRSGACSVKYEVRAWNAGYVADSSAVIANYNYWDGENLFRVPDLQLQPE